MGRHGTSRRTRRRAHVDVPPGLAGVAGWGLFATAVGTVSVGWADRSWPPALAVAALGVSSTGLLWSVSHRPPVRPTGAGRPAPAELERPRSQSDDVTTA